MIGYVTLGTNDIERAAAFYDGCPERLSRLDLDTPINSSISGVAVPKAVLGAHWV